MAGREISNVERELGNIGRQMMDAAVTEKCDKRSNELARVGDMLTRVGTIYGPTVESFTAEDHLLVEEFAANEYNPNRERIHKG